MATAASCPRPDRVKLAVQAGPKYIATAHIAAGGCVEAVVARCMDMRLGVLVARRPPPVRSCHPSHRLPIIHSHSVPSGYLRIDRVGRNLSAAIRSVQHMQCQLPAARRRGCGAMVSRSRSRSDDRKNLGFSSPESSITHNYDNRAFERGTQAAPPQLEMSVKN